MKKRVEKNQSGSASELFSSGESTKPIEGKFARTAELAAEFPFAKIDENLLRRLSREDNLDPGTGAPWLPSAVGGKWPVAETIRGLWSYAEHRARESAGWPKFASMELCESAGHIPRKIQKQMARLGVVFTRPGCGIDFDALLRGIEQHILIPVSLGDSAKLSAMGLKGIEQINTNQEIGLKIREEREALQRKALLEKGEMLLTTDGAAAITKLKALELFEENFAGHRRRAIAKLPATINRQHRTVLREAGVPAATIRRCAHIVTTARDQLLAGLETKIPELKPSDIDEEAVRAANDLV